MVNVTARQEETGVAGKIQCSMPSCTLGSTVYSHAEVVGNGCSKMKSKVFESTFSTCKRFESLSDSHPPSAASKGSGDGTLCIETVKKREVLECFVVASALRVAKFSQRYELFSSKRTRRLRTAGWMWSRTDLDHVGLTIRGTKWTRRFSLVDH
jgi:hypothetical protein